MDVVKWLGHRIGEVLYLSEEMGKAVRRKVVQSSGDATVDLAGEYASYKLDEIINKLKQYFENSQVAPYLLGGALIALGADRLLDRDPEEVTYRKLKRQVIGSGLLALGSLYALYGINRDLDRN